MDPRIVKFYRQYLQQLHNLSFPAADVLLEPPIQEQICQYMFDDEDEVRTRHLPPAEYQRRILKTLAQKIETAIRDPDKDEISDRLIQHLATRISAGMTMPGYAAVLQKSVVSYHLPSDCSSAEDTQSIHIEEARNLLAAQGTTGLRVWDAGLHLASYLTTTRDGAELIRGKRVLELGAGTGLVSILCAGPLRATAVLATDGDAAVLESIRRNVALNQDLLKAAAGGGNEDCLEVRLLDWTREYDFNAEGKNSNIDVILGSDITYDVDLLEPLAKLMATLHDHHPAVTIIISAVVRNEETFAVFIKHCAANGLHVTDIPFNCPPIQDQIGLFHNHSSPIRTMRIQVNSKASVDY